MGGLQLLALRDFPLVKPGDDLAVQISHSLADNQLTLQDGDIVVLAQKIVSKSENRYRTLKDITPRDEAVRLAQETGKDPRAVELVLQESNRVLRYRYGSIVVEHKLGFVHANAGIDQSNLPDNADSEMALLLPENSDASAQALRDALQKKHGVKIGVVINDSFG
ncbi:MAG TPA: coenzyme F420-0:L-glutamate ligase, partial [Pseudomonadales bacterium]|nr:coenzyme F420-0:L-glutamate ligase [Pseudomonadales bacterium]